MMLYQKLRLFILKLKKKEEMLVTTSKMISKMKKAKIREAVRSRKLLALLVF